ncbi:MAG: 50S ribosomal protein L11 methyltransferase [Pseudanabaenaceae cyanobacterium]
MSNQPWWEIRVTAPPSLEESIFWRLSRFGCRGMVTEPTPTGSEVLLRSYIPQQQATWLDLAALTLWLRQDALLQDQPEPQVRCEALAEEDWNQSWKRHWQPLEVGDTLAVYPAWIPVPADLGRQAIRIDPGSAFGTGDHPTTKMCLEALEFRLAGEKDLARFTLADVGCGSGILGVGAYLLGCRKIYLVDTDPLAVQASAENLVLNGVPEEAYWLREGSLGELLSVLPEPVGGFVCNIQTEVIVGMVPYFAALTQPEGWGILSGVPIEKYPVLAEALDREKWTVATLWKRQGWCCLTIRRQPPRPF